METQAEENFLRIRNILEASEFNGSDKLQVILQALFRKRSGQTDLGTSEFAAFWDAAHFKLDQVELFQDCNPDEKRKVLERCAKSLLEEAYFIEKLGLSFNAKMILLSKTTQERMLYSLFAAEEASHLESVSRFLPPEHKSFSSQPFLQLLEEVIEDGQKLSLTYLIQMILEGWGMSHYLELSDDCQSVALKEVLVQIVRDESIHHGSGVVLFDEASLAKAERKFILEILVRLFQMVQAGPQFVVSSLEQVKGQLSKQMKIQVFRELDCEAQSQKRISLLISLMGKKHITSLVDDLECFHVLRPLSAVQCAAISNQ